MNESFARIEHRISAAALLLALCVPAHTALAKVGVPYGSDGIQDSDTQAKAQAYNNDLDGPKDGQSEEDWEIQLKVDHDALYGTGETYGASTTSSSSDAETDASTPPPDPPIDLCQTTLDDWISTSSTMPMTEALKDPSLVTELDTALENFVYTLVLIQTATTGSVKVLPDRPTVSDLRCTADGSTLKAVFPIRVKDFGVTLDHGTLVLHGSPSYHEWTDENGHDRTDWCFDVASYSVSGFSSISLEVLGSRLYDDLNIKRFCSPAYTPPPWGTKTSLP